MSASHYKMPFSFVWYLTGIAAGSHTYAMQIIEYGCASYISAGYVTGDTANSLVVSRPLETSSQFTPETLLLTVCSLSVCLQVEERARGSIATAGPFTDQRGSSTGWANIPERSVSHTKLNANTIMRVTYMDTIGWLYSSAGQGCTWRVVVDGVALSREFWMYADTSASG